MALAVFASLLFGATVWAGKGLSQRGGNGGDAQVVLPAFAQVLLYGGDRFLAASVESVRAAASGSTMEASLGGYRLRAHRVVSQLNPCHEDNYWIGNAALSFGGAADAGLDLLGRATQCRFWDEMPPFFYGFNQRFFRLDPKEARRAIELAADRATENAVAYRQMAIMMTVNAIRDVRAALAMLQHEHDASRDSRLREILGLRIGRLRGLLALREARNEYEVRFAGKLESPNDLIRVGIIAEFPRDPIGLGYDFRDGDFHLRQIVVDGLD